MTYQEWADKLKRLDNHINNLKTWDDYAESCQREYDWLLKQKPIQEKQDENNQSDS